MLAFSCPGCGQRLQVRAELAGGKVKCPKCQVLVTAPTPAAVTPMRPQPGAPNQAPADAQAPHPDSPPENPVTRDDADTHGECRPPAVSAPQSPLDYLAPAQRPDELGRLGPYRVLKVLGAGGMGSVFLAEDATLRRPVALKVMKPELARDVTARQRFLREARTAAAVAHDHVITILQVGEDRDVPYLAMQYLEGEVLESRLRREGKLPVREVLRLGREIAGGLAAAHAKGLIHRDIKPANVWLEGPRGRVKILDFGLARAVEEDAHLTKSGMIVGTPAYMAPEQTNDEARVGHRCDLYSLGCVLYRCATGRLPFLGKDTLAVLASVLTQPPPRPRELNPELPAEFSELILGLLHKDPDQRPATAREVVERLEALERAAHDRAPGASPSRGAGQAPDRDPVAPPVAVPQMGSVQDLETQPLARPGRTAPRRLLLALGLLLLATLIGLGAVLTVRTAPGTLVVTVSEPDVQVFVDGTERVTLDAANRGRVGLAPGVHTLTVRRGADELFAKEFTLASRGETVIEARWQPKTAVVKETPSVAEVPRPRIGASPLDRLDPKMIPASERFDWQPKELVAVLGEHRRRHWNAVTALAVSPDGKLVATADYSVGKTVYFWDADSMEPVRDFRLDSSGVWSLLFHPRRPLLFVANRNIAAYAWTDKSLNRAWSVPCENAVPWLRCTPDGETLIAWNTKRQLLLLDPQQKTPTLRVWFEGCDAPSLSPDGRLLSFLSLAEKTVKLFEVSAGEPKQQSALPVTEEVVVQVPLAKDRLLTVNGEGMIRTWDLAGKEPKQVAGLQGPKPWMRVDRSVGFSVGERHLAYGVLLDSKRGYSVQLVALDQVLPSIGPQVGPTWGGGAFTLSHADKYLYVEDSGKIIRCWDVSVAPPIERHPIDSRTVLGTNNLEGVPALLFPDNRTLVASTPGGSRVWVLGQAAPQAVEIPGVTTGRQFPHGISPDGQALTMGGQGTTRVVRMAGRDVLSIPLSSGKDFFTGSGCPFSPDGSTVATLDGESLLIAGKGQLRLWSLHGEKAAQKAVLDAGGPAKRVDGLSFAHDGTRLVARADDSIRLWDLTRAPDSQPLVQKVPSLQCAAIAPDGKVVAAVGGPRAVQIWHYEDGKLSLRGIGNAVRSPKWVTFSPDGRRVAVATVEGQLQLWDVASMQVQREWQLPGVIVKVIWASDGRHLLTVNGNYTVYVLRLAPPPAQGRQ